MSAQFPNVPNVPGVPTVKRLAGAIANAALQRLTRDSLIGVEQDATRWGIYSEGGALALEPDSIFAFEFAREYRISDYPIEGGKFESYDKVQTPYVARLEMVKAGTDLDRQQFLAALDALVNDTDTYDIVTPDKFYPKANVVRYDMRRTAINGVTMLTVNVVIQQVREAAAAKFTSSKSPSGADTASNGPVQPVAVQGAQPSGV